MEKKICISQLNTVSKLLDIIPLEGTEKTKLDQIRSQIEDLKDDLKEDKREFIVYWLPGAYEPDYRHYTFKHFERDGFYEEFIEEIDKLDVSDRAEQECVLVIRTK